MADFNKPFKSGIIIGRFQPIHNGHLDMIEKAAKMCNSLTIMVGSSQESGTIKNPLSYEQRDKLIGAVLDWHCNGTNISIIPLPDAHVGDGPEWGDYVVKKFMQSIGEVPDAIFTAQENVRTNWFNNYVNDMALIAFPKYEDIHATDLRKYLAEDNFYEWAKRTPCEIWKFYNEIKSAIKVSLKEE